MNAIRKVVLIIVITVAVCSLLFWLTGNQHMFNAIASTYLVGKTGPTIDDLYTFENRKISSGKHEPWYLSEKYNTISNDSLLQEIEKLDPAAFLVVKNDSIVYEKYWGNYTDSSHTNSFSMAKTFVALLVGIAIEDGLINSVDDKVGRYLEEYKEFPELKIKDLLTMSSGINFDESYASPFGHMAKAYYGDDIRGLNTHYTVTEKSGEQWKYVGGNTIILSFIVEKVTGKSISSYMSEKVWKRIGARSAAYWSLDADGGVEKAYCCFYSNARDFARIGKLYLNKGSWNGEVIVDEDYVKASVSPAYYLKDRKGNPVDFYGYQMWMTYYKNMDVFYARGIQGQFIVVIPEKNLVVVRLGNKRGTMLPNYHSEDLYTYIDFALGL